MDRVAALARRLIDEGYIEYEIDAWRTAVLIVASCDPPADGANTDATG